MTTTPSQMHSSNDTFRKFEDQDVFYYTHPGLLLDFNVQKSNRNYSKAKSTFHASPFDEPPFEPLSSHSDIYSLAQQRRHRYSKHHRYPRQQLPLFKKPHDHQIRTVILARHPGMVGGGVRSSRGRRRKRRREVTGTEQQVEEKATLHQVRQRRQRRVSEVRTERLNEAARLS